MFNLSKETIIAGVAVVAATVGLIAGDIAVSNHLLKRRVAALLEELKSKIKNFHEEASKEVDWSQLSEGDKVLKIERLIAHDILNITNTYDPKVVVHLRQEVVVEIKKVIAE